MSENRSIDSRIPLRLWFQRGESGDEGERLCFLCVEGLSKSSEPIGLFMTAFPLPAVEGDEDHNVGQVCANCASLNEQQLRWFLRVLGRHDLFIAAQPAENTRHDKAIQRYHEDAGRTWLEYAERAEITLLGAQSARHRPKGHVYLLGSPDGYCKIGRTVQLSQRLLSLSLQLPFKVELIHSIPTSDPVWAERYLHRRFGQCRLNGEWFLLSKQDIEWIGSLTRLEPGEAER